ncbi:MAG: histidine phosphatase family protein [Bacteroidetes bacterium]|nr:histidine phosphatase family protein [Bacteroidota bacterium]
MLKQLYLIRHGQTDFNLKGIVQGSGVDAPLNEFGMKQAAAFHSAYAHLDFDMVFVSELQRTHQSVAAFANRITTEKHAGLNEIGWGIHEGKAVTASDRADFKRLIHDWQQGKLERSLPFGESALDVARRQQPILSKLNTQTEEQILVCMHGRAMRILLCQLLKIPLQEMDQFEHSNLCLYHLEMNANQNWNVLKFNDTRHLDLL